MGCSEFIVVEIMWIVREVVYGLQGGCMKNVVWLYVDCVEVVCRM